MITFRNEDVAKRIIDTYNGSSFHRLLRFTQFFYQNYKFIDVMIELYLVTNLVIFCLPFNA